MFSASAHLAASGVALQVAEGLETTRISLSLAHTSALAMAAVILENDN
jgi:phosphopantetheinyl transferase (holo-ACP synthase)